MRAKPHSDALARAPAPRVVLRRAMTAIVIVPIAPAVKTCRAASGGTKESGSAASAARPVPATSQRYPACRAATSTYRTSHPRQRNNRMAWRTAEAPISTAAAREVGAAAQTASAGKIAASTKTS